VKIDKSAWPTVAVTLPVDPKWIRHLTQTRDIFAKPHASGYWLRFMDHDPELGHLAYEYEGDTDPSALIAEIVNGWRFFLTKPLPPRWHRIDRDVALRTWGEAVKLYGENWYEEVDGVKMDCALQMALLGELRYG
jgi:hypothetical protein